MPRQSIDEKLSQLEASIAEADAQALPTVLHQALEDRNYRIVAYAAHIAGEKLVYDCVPHLLAAYPAFLEKPVKRDPVCTAKKAIMRALYDLDCDDVDLYLAAIRYRQMEPVWGGTVDTATDVRSSAAMGLVSSGYSRALLEVAELLVDSEPPVRSGAVRAVACGNPREAELLLRAKVLAGDAEPLVIGDCFAGLLTVEPDESVPFVARYLDAQDEAICEAAALALGESRLPAALDTLKASWDGVLISAEHRRVLIRATALHRSDEAFDWLLELLAETGAPVAADIVDVLSIYRHNEKLKQRLTAVIESRGDAEPKAMFDQAWR